MICESCGVGMQENVPHTCTGTIFDRVRRKAEILARQKAKTQARKAGPDDWRQYELRVLYDMLDANHNAGEASPDNKFSSDDLQAIDASMK